MLVIAVAFGLAERRPVPVAFADSSHRPFEHSNEAAAVADPVDELAVDVPCDDGRLPATTSHVLGSIVEYA